MNTKVTKAVIPVGGMGTRFLPITKAVPKEILPVVDTPVLAFIVDEMAASGITDIMLILGNGKEAIRAYFSPSPELERALEEAGKTEYLKLVRDAYGKANIVFGRQDKPLGSGDAVLKAEKFTGGEPFVIAWGDDLIYSKVPVAKQLCGAFDKYGASILGVQKYLTDDIVKYGVADVEFSDGYAHKCRGIVEKPPLSKLPSRLASLGRYVVTKDIYGAIRGTAVGKGNELQFTDALNKLCPAASVYAYEFEGRRYDMGDKGGAAEAVVEYALRSPEIGGRFKEYLKGLKI